MSTWRCYLFRSTYHVCIKNVIYVDQNVIRSDKMSIVWIKMSLWGKFFKLRQETILTLSSNLNFLLHWPKTKRSISAEWLQDRWEPEPRVHGLKESKHSFENDVEWQDHALFEFRCSDSNCDSRDSRLTSGSPFPFHRIAGEKAPKRSIPGKHTWRQRVW